MERKSTLEKLSDSLPAKITTTALAAFSGNPLAVFLPILTNTLAGSRHKERVEKAIIEIEKILKDHEEKIQYLSDAQYKIISETILTIFQTIDEAKLEYLKRAIKNSLLYSDISPHDAERISRIIRDISTAEAKFLIKSKSYEFFLVGNKTKNPKKTLRLERGSTEAKIVDGLASLGLLLIGGETWNELFHFRFSPIASGIIRLLE